MAAIQKFLFIALAVFPAAQCFKAYHPDFYGKPCTNDSTLEPSLAHCDLDKNMYCSEKAFCECIIGERGRLFSHFEKACIEIASPENGFACGKDVQCTLSSFGKYSRCNMDYGKCECYDGNENTTLVENVCFIQKPPERLGSYRSFQGCSTDENCQSSNLGRLSRCNKAGPSCECYDTESSGKQDVGLHNGKCIFKKKLGEYCNNDDECRAGYHKNAICAQHASYLDQELVCQCPEGKRCDGDGGSGAYSSFQSQSMMMIGVTTVVMGLLATKVLS